MKESGTEPEPEGADNNTSESAPKIHYKYPIQSGIPPWHSIVFVVVAGIITVMYLPSSESLDDYATVDVLTNSKYPQYLPLLMLGVLRIVVGCCAIALTIYLACFVEGGWVLYPNYLQSKSKLRHVPLKLTGFGTLCPFTSMSWLLFGVGFIMRGLLGVVLHEQQQQQQQQQQQDGLHGLLFLLLKNRTYLRITFVMWELTAPFAMLTSSIIKYAIWPMALKGGKKHNLSCFRNQLQHNSNSILSLMEVAVLGGIPVCLDHLAYAILFGCFYMIFTWCTGIYYHGNQTTIGPQYIYFFMDTTLGAITSYAILGLLIALTTCFVLFSWSIQLLDYMNNNSTGEIGNGEGEDSLFINIGFVLVGTFVVCRFRD